MQIENLTNNKIKVTFTVTKEDFEIGLNNAFEENKKKVKIDGFRPGHVTREIFEKKYGDKALFQDAAYFCVEEKYQEFIKAKTHIPVGRPDLSLDVEAIERGKDFEFSITVVVKPEAVLGEYKGLKVKKANTAVTDFEVDEQIENLQKRDATLAEKTGENVRLELKDTAVFDYQGLLEGVEFPGGSAENFSLEIGSGQFIPGFEEQMIGMKAEESKDLNVTFPENYHEESLKGKAVVFKVKLHEIKTKILPELTDEYIKGLKIEGVSERNALEAHFRSKLEKNKENSEENRISEDLLALLRKNSTVDIPSEMLDREEDFLKTNVTQQAKQYGLDLDTFLAYTGQSKEKFELEIRNEAEKRVRNDLVLAAIGKELNIAISEEKINERYDELAKMYKKSSGEIRKLIDKEDIIAELKINDAMSFVKDNAIYE